MIDPGALGTTILGLRAASETQNDRPQPSRSTQRRARAGVRLALAHGLRRAASALERPTASEGAGG